MVYIDKNACIVKNTSNNIALNVVKNWLYESMWAFLITTSTVTCVSDVLDLHVDEPKSNPLLKGNKGFVKTRALTAIHFYLLQMWDIHPWEKVVMVLEFLL